jgi:hypothetical protein
MAFAHATCRANSQNFILENSKIVSPSNLANDTERGMTEPAMPSVQRSTFTHKC